MEEICIENGYDERYKAMARAKRLNWVAAIYGRDGVQRNQGNSAYAC
jgi:hypothetical protein